VTAHLLDTNVALRLAEPSAPEHRLVKGAVVGLAQAGQPLVIAPQVLVEFWVVATRPVDVNGFGWAPPLAARALADLRGRFPLLDESPAVFERWFSLVQGADVRGKRAHDARIAALMLVNGISHVLTLNPGDFSAFPGVVSVHPSAVVGR
jgi:predicted nucleic acid-binding protein